MFGFLLKKNFCDGWDNLFSLVLVNLCFLVAGSALIGGYALLIINTPLGSSDSQLLTVGITSLFLFSFYFVYCIVAFSFSEQAVKIANFGAISLVEFFKTIPSVLKDAALYALATSAFTIVSVLAILWYIQQGSILYLFMGCLFVWFDFFAILTLQWFIPIRAIMHNNFKKCLKKSFIIMLDNTGFTFAMLLYGFVLLLLSIFFMGLAPSVSGMVLARVNALRLRLYKYDYLELHPELKTKSERKDIPWEELIYEDRETLGPRKFRSFLFPWKD